MINEKKYTLVNKEHFWKKVYMNKTPGEHYFIICFYVFNFFLFFLDFTIFSTFWI
jgi:hypothetical protein